MDSKICVVCNIEKSIDNFYNKYRECKPCNIKRSTRRTMKTKIKYQINIQYTMKKIEINFYRNKMIIAKKEAQIIKNYKDPMLNYKIN